MVSLVVDKFQKHSRLIAVSDVSGDGGRVNPRSRTMGSRGCALPDWAHRYTSHLGTTIRCHGNGREQISQHRHIVIMSSLSGVFPLLVYTYIYILLNTFVPVTYSSVPSLLRLSVTFSYVSSVTISSSLKLSNNTLLSASAPAM